MTKDKGVKMVTNDEVIQEFIDTLKSGEFMDLGIEGKIDVLTAVLLALVKERNNL